MQANIPEQVGVQQRSPAVRRGLAEEARVIEAGVVHQDVEWAGVLDHGLGRVHVGDVGLHGPRPDCGRELLRHVERAARDDHLGAVGGQPRGDPGADPATASGDDSPSSGQRAHGQMPLKTGLRRSITAASPAARVGRARELGHRPGLLRQLALDPRDRLRARARARRGGMSRVFVARRNGARAEGGGQGAAARARRRRERRSLPPRDPARRAAAAPHIVPLLAAGETDGLPFYTMPFVEGQSLRDAAVARRRAPDRRRAAASCATSPTRWPTPTRAASSTATSSRTTCCCRAAQRS